MKLCVTGPSGAGKTTLTTLLQRILPECKAIFGDDYITCTHDRIDDLLSIINVSDSYILDHVSAINIIQRAEKLPNLIVILLPDFSLLKSRRRLYIRENVRPEEIRQKYAKHFASAVRLGIKVASFDNSQAAINWVLHQLFQLGILPPRIQTVVLKVATNCNINCDYCYMYQGYDTEWRSLPPYMNETVASHTGRRINEYLMTRPYTKVSVALHGGEPLTMPLASLERIVDCVRAPLASNNLVQLGLQTNGLRLNDRVLCKLDELGLTVGISLDAGTKQGNRHRLTFSGRDTYKQVERAIRRCVDYPFVHGQFGGVLCVVSPDENGAAIYNYFRSLGVRSLDFLLCDRDHDAVVGPPSSGDNFIFLRDAFDAWLADPHPGHVRLFRSIIGMILGENWTTDAIGLAPMNFLAVNTSGEWELLDLLRTSFEGAWKTPFNVFDHSITDVTSSNTYIKIIQSQYDLSDTCLGCKHLHVCGGGYLPHRFSREHGFRNPSVYCKDLLRLIAHIDLAIKKQLVEAREAYEVSLLS